MRRVGLSLALVLACAGPGLAQTLDDLRDAIRQSLRKVNFARGSTGLVAIADELELSTASLDFDNGSELTNTGLPFHTVVPAFGESKTRLYLEGVFGYARLDDAVADLWSGNLPGLETGVSGKWSTYGLYLGAGPSFQLAKGLTLAAIANGGIARIESSATYSGPGAELTAALLDGIAFNWSSYVWSAGGALRVDWERPLGGGHNLSLIGRYDLRWFGSFDEDDPAQEFSDRAQIATLRADVLGPFGISIFQRALFWRATVGYRRFLESDVNDAVDFVELGGGLEIDIDKVLPLGSRVSVRGAIILGEDFTGWSFGVGFSF